MGTVGTPKEAVMRKHLVALVLMVMLATGPAAASATIVADFQNGWSDWVFAPPGGNDTGRFTTIGATDQYDTFKGYAFGSPDGKPFGMVQGGNPDAALRSTASLSFLLTKPATLRLWMGVNHTDYYDDGVTLLLENGGFPWYLFYSTVLQDGVESVIEWTQLTVSLAPGPHTLIIDAFNGGDNFAPPVAFIGSIDLIPDDNGAAPVPEPVSGALLALGLVAAVGFSRKENARR